MSKDFTIRRATYRDTKAIHEVVALLDAKDVADVPFDPDPRT